MPVRSEIIWALNHACEQRALCQVELTQILSEVGLRSFAKPIDRKAAALPKINLVGIHLEDLLLIEASFELKRNHDLGDLPRVGFLWR